MPSSRAADLRHGRRVAGRQREGRRTPPRARSTNRRTASDSRQLRGRRQRAGRRAGPATARARRVSPATPSASRLVARMRRPGQARSSGVGQRGRRRRRRCSQLSSTSSSRCGRSGVRERRQQRPARLLPHAQRRGHRLGHQRRVGQRRQLDQPHAVRERVRPAPAATCSARRVLPTPPAPVSVSRRVAAEQARATAASSRSRPTKLVSWSGQVVRGQGGDEAIAGAMSGLDEAGRLGVVAQGLPDLADGHLEDRLRDGRVGPHPGHQLVFGREAPGALDKETQHGIRLRAQGDHLGASIEALPAGIQAEGWEMEGPLDVHGSGLADRHSVAGRGYPGSARLTEVLPDLQDSAGRPPEVLAVIMEVHS